MKKILLLFLIFLSCRPAKCAESSPSPGKRRPTPVIFDTDIGNDVDDVLALAMLHALQSRGVCQLLAVTITNPDELAVSFVDALNTFYHRPLIPIGRYEGSLPAKPSKFLSRANAMDGSLPRYPHRLRNAKDAPGAVSLLRRTLNAQADHSVVIIQVGYFSNLSALLDSKADDSSPLDGLRLVEKKVRLLSVMAGAFRAAEIQKHFLEFNVVNDVTAATNVGSRWPTPIIWSGFEIGIALPYPARSISNDFNYAPHHLVAEAYNAFEPPPHERPTWDLTSVLYPLFPRAGYFDLSPAGTVKVAADGFITFEPQEGGRDRFLILPPGTEGRIKEALSLFASQPPSSDPTGK
jgi:hypothetical protein